jgi:hypothetical protein
MGYSFTFNFSEKDIDFSPRSDHFFNYHKFLINEFFNATDDEMLVIMTVYHKKFGKSALDYVLRNYYRDWRNGDRTLSNVQESRILSIMPDLLNEKAKQRLNQIKEEARYKLGIEEILALIKRIVEAFFSTQKNIYSKQKIASPEDIINLFQKEVERVKELKILEQTSRYGTENIIILTEDEKSEALKISQYIVFVKLHKQFHQIEKDFNTFLPFMQGFRRGMFQAFYKISAFNINLELTNANFIQVVIPKLTINEIASSSRFKEYSDRYLAYELVNINNEANKAIVTAFLNHSDIKLFFDHYEELSQSDSEIDIKSTFTGEGGLLNIKAKMKPTKMLKVSVFMSLIKILIYTAIMGGAVSLICAYRIWAMLFYAAIFIIGFYVTLVSEEIKQIKTLKSEIKLYGK